MLISNFVGFFAVADPSFLIFSLFSINDSRNYKEIRLYLSTKKYPKSLRNTCNLKQNFRSKCNNFALFYVGHYLGLSMKTYPILIGLIQQSWQTRSVESFPSFIMQKVSAREPPSCMYFRKATLKGWPNLAQRGKLASTLRYWCYICDRVKREAHL